MPSEGPFLPVTGGGTAPILGLAGVLLLAGLAAMAVRCRRVV